MAGLWSYTSSPHVSSYVSLVPLSSCTAYCTLDSQREYDQCGYLSNFIRHTCIFHLFEIKLFCFAVAMSDLVYNVEAIHDLC